MNKISRKKIASKYALKSWELFKKRVQVSNLYVAGELYHDQDPVVPHVEEQPHLRGHRPDQDHPPNLYIDLTMYTLLLLQDEFQIFFFFSCISENKERLYFKCALY